MLNQLTAFQQRYRTALYTYLRIINLPQAHASFLNNPKTPPVFNYPPSVAARSAADRLDHLKNSLSKTSPKQTETYNFLKHRILETEILLLFCKMNEEPKQKNVKNLKRYSRLQSRLYGKVDKTLFVGIISNLQQIAIRKGVISPLISKVASNLSASAIDQSLYQPKLETFKAYKRLYENLWPELNEIINSAPDDSHLDVDSIKQLLERSLASIDASSRGWEVEMSPKGANISISKHRRRVLLSSHIQPRTFFRLKQIIAHEIGCHVNRSLHFHDFSEAIEEEEEGLAIVLEQLMSKRFIHKRTMRYLALCLAQGLDSGIPRNFSETYEIMKQAFNILCMDHVEAEHRAFYETARIFRGGFPDVAGAVYIKDKIYLESNLKVWKRLEDSMLNKQSFSVLFQKNKTKMKQEAIQ
jgi:hypothetical protein